MYNSQCDSGIFYTGWVTVKMNNYFLLSVHLNKPAERSSNFSLSSSPPRRLHPLPQLRVELGRDVWMRLVVSNVDVLELSDTDSEKVVVRGLFEERYISVKAVPKPLLYKKILNLDLNY